MEEFANAACHYVDQHADSLEFPAAETTECIIMGHSLLLRRGEFSAFALMKLMSLATMVLNNGEIPTLLRRTFEAALPPDIAKSAIMLLDN